MSANHYCLKSLLLLTALVLAGVIGNQLFCYPAYAAQSGRSDTLIVGKDTRFNKALTASHSQGWYGNADVSSADGQVVAMDINVGKPGAITFAIGLIDQNNLFIVEREFTRKLGAGINKLTLYEPIKSGQQILIKTPVAGLRCYVGSGGKLVYTEKGYNAPLSTRANATLSFSYRIALNQTNTPVSTEAASRPVRSTRAYKNVLIIGNSITRHGLAPYWWGNWGMAASTAENDFVHVLVGLLRQQNPSLSFSVIQAANWERNHETFALSAYDTAFIRQPDLVVIRLGENVRDVTNYKTSYLNLLTYIQQKVPTATVVTTGSFWTNAAKDMVMSEASNEAGVLFIPLSKLDTKENKSNMGAVVGGEDRVEHRVDHTGVANHPGDLGMKRIAETIFSRLP
ncbi:hypothetical protein GCM10027341_35120 [Spirosoma knui]